MIVRIAGLLVGVLLLFYILLLRGLPVLFFIKMAPLLLIFLLAAILIYAAVTSD